HAGGHPRALAQELLLLRRPRRPPPRRAVPGGTATSSPAPTRPRGCPRPPSARPRIRSIGTCACGPGPACTPFHKTILVCPAYSVQFYMRRNSVLRESLPAYAPQEWDWRCRRPVLEAQETCVARDPVRLLRD